MKKNILFVFIGGLLLFAACNPIEKRDSLSPALSVEELDSKVSVTLTGNTVSCSVDHTCIAYWTTNSGKQGVGEDLEFYLPLRGDYTVTCTVISDAEKVSITRNVVVPESDPDYYSSPLWDLLTNGPDGKTWVWATDKPEATIWGVAPWFSDPQIVNGTGIWWGQNFPDIEGQGTSADDELYFDLNQSHHYVLTQTGADAKPGSGSGSFDMDLSEDNMLLWSADGSVFSYGTITFTNSTIPIASNDGGDYHYTYDILKLTADELVLAYFVDGVDRATEGAWGPCWVYQFKRKGYSYK